MAKQQENRQGERQYQDPFSLLDSMFERMQRDMFGRTLFSALLPTQASETESGVVRVPRVQMRDTGDALELTAELPGIAPEDVKVELEDDTLTLRGETQTEEETDGERTERYVCFYRQIQLPDGIDVDQAQASYKNGVLSIRFPKPAERGNVRQIPVQTESGAQQTAAQQSGGQQAQQTAAKEKAA